MEYTITCNIRYIINGEKYKIMDTVSVITDQIDKFIKYNLSDIIHSRDNRAYFEKIISIDKKE